MMKKKYMIPQTLVELTDMEAILVQVQSNSLAGGNGTAGDVAESQMHMAIEEQEMGETSEELW